MIFFPVCFFTRNTSSSLITYDDSGAPSDHMVYAADALLNSLHVLSPSN